MAAVQGTAIGPVGSGWKTIRLGSNSCRTVVDLVSAYTGKGDSHNSSEVRGLLAPLAELAGRRRLAVLAYRIDDGRVVWELDPVKMHADEAFAAELKAANGGDRRGAERREAIQWLREQLKDGPVAASELAELGEQYGFNKQTLQRAFKQLGGKRTKQSFNGQWLWSLADEGDTEGDK